MAEQQNLEKLKEQITALGDKIRDLKAASADAAQIGAVVAELNTAKKLYADNNNGIGVDGKPFEAPMSKAEKKAKAKAEKKDTAGGAAAAAAPAEETDPNSVNAQKKAAKKDAKKAAKKAYKEGDAPPPAAGAGSSTPTAGPAVTAAPVKGPAAPKVAAATSVPAVPGAATPGAGVALTPLQIAINPNVPLTQRPIVAMSVAVLTDTAIDLDIVSDHKCRHTALGLEGGGTVAGDLAMARYLARRRVGSTGSSIVPSEPSQAAVVDAWVDYAQSLRLLESPLPAITLTLEHALQNSTYLVGHTGITLADLAVFAAAGFPTQVADLERTLLAMPEQAVHARRWLKMMASHPALQEATQLCIGIASNAEAIVNDVELDPLVPGMNTLEGAIAGRVTTRFPPEPSGYLHIGHAKAVLLNDYYARRYKGRLIVRFDDTNPSKEKQEYQDSIVQDLKKLGVQPDLVTYTSDSFDVIQKYAIQMIEKGLAYMDDTPQEQMKLERADRIESKHRNSQTPAQAMEYFNQMCSGSVEGSVWCLRAKIDMNSDNGTLRDPVFYRQNLEPHHRCGTKYKAYPTYDMACPIVDSIEGVTHALRTTEYNDRDEQYQWLLKALGLRRVRIHAFSRVNFKNTVLSKRKLTWFVENNYVTGWDDARMPTVRGVIRRGVNVSCLKNFMYSQGASRRIVMMDWSTFWAENKKELDKTARRYMAIDKDNNVKLTITNAPKESDYSFVRTSLHPKDPTMGERVVRIASEVLLETVDVEGIVVGESVVLMRWGVVKITKVIDGNNLEGEFDPNGVFKDCKRKLTWMANVAENPLVTLTEFDNLVSKDKLEEEDNFMDYINPNTMATTEAIGDVGLKNLQEHDVIQLERRGFYRVDRPYINADKPLILYMIPDGKIKAMSGITGKLAHR